jgi:hypothetical protein
MAESQSQKRGGSMMSKKRFYAIQDILHQYIQNPDVESQISHHIMEIMNFDPQVSRYTPEIGQKTKEYRQKKKLESKTT